MSRRGVLFDLFHTLTGRETTWSVLPPTSEILGVDGREWNRLLMESSRWRLAGEIKDRFAILRTLADTIDPTISDERIRTAAKTRGRRFRDALRSIPEENIETLKQLRTRRIRLGLISNADVMEAEGWPESPLCGLFDAELFSCEVGSAKPEPEIYRLCLSRIGLPPGCCLFVGDGGSGELEGAKALGMETVLMSGIIQYLWPDRIPALREFADHEIERIPDLLRLIPCG